MKNFKSGNRSRNRKDSFKRRPLLHDAVCDECGKDCQVPFKPTGEKPIYCSDCFQKKSGRDNGRSSQKTFRKRSFGNRDSRRPLLYDAVCDECGKDCQVPFKPSGEKPIYCSDCFEKKGGGGSDRSRNRKDSSRSDRSISQLIEKIEILNTKLDKIIDLLLSAGKKKSELVEDKAKKSKVESKTKKGKKEKSKKSKKTKADEVKD